MIYRVSILTELLVEADNETEARKIGFRNVVEEIKNGTAKLYRMELLESQEDLKGDERGSLPWRSSDRKTLPELRVEEILPSGLDL
jgi:hypothetical protein